MPYQKNSNPTHFVDLINNDVRIYWNQFARALDPAGTASARKDSEAFAGKQKLAGDASRGDRIFGFDVTEN
jgi:hypothetical protein